MRKTVTALIAIGAAGIPFAAQADVTLYGLIDTTIRFSTNENAAGDSKWQMSDGLITGSRWGIRGTEDLGGNLKTWYILESGYAPDTGVSLQGGRLFGRTAVVGLDGDFGRIVFGRQYTLASDIIGSYDALSVANHGIIGFQGGNYTGLRYDNTVKYIKSFGPLQVAGAYTFGEVAGNFSGNSAAAGSLVYSSGPLEIGGVYQVTHDVSTAYFGAVPPSQASKQTFFSIGGTYKASRTQYFLGYSNNRLDVADYRNDLIYAGIRFNLTGALALVGEFNYDWLQHAGQGGKRLSTAAMLDYNVSKRTDVYLEADYTHLRGAWVALNGSPGFISSANTFGNSTRLGVMAGLRHKF